jgi:SOS-response transcriptional repressor LexA
MVNRQVLYPAFPRRRKVHPHQTTMSRPSSKSVAKRDVSTRLIALREKLGIRSAELARRLGVSRSYVTHLEQGKPCSLPVQKLIEKMEAEATGNQISEPPPKSGGICADASFLVPPLASAVTVMTTPARSAFDGKLPSTAAHHRAVTIPMLSMSQASVLDSVDKASLITREQFVCGASDERAFAVRISNDAMEPQHLRGEIAIVYPSEHPRDGDRVLARLRDDNGGSVLFRIFHLSDRGKGVILSSPNQAYPALQYQRDAFTWIHPIAATVRSLKDMI